MGSSTSTRLLSEHLAQWFTSAVRGRGIGYFRQGQVGDISGNETHVEAEVHGSDLYFVTLDFKPANAVLRVSCSCPYGYENSDPCKHAWATILKAEKIGKLSAVLAARRPRIEVDAPESDDEDDLDVINELAASIEPAVRRKAARPVVPIADEADDDRDLSGPIDLNELQRLMRDMGLPLGSKVDPAALRQFMKMARAIAPDPGDSEPRPKAPQPAKPPRWEVGLNRVKALVNPDGPTRENQWDPSKRELWYTLDWMRTKQSGHMCFDLSYRERKLNGEWSKHKNSGVRLEEIDRMPPGPDRDVLAMVQGSRHSGSRWGGYYYDPATTQFTLAPALERHMLPLLCGTGRCVIRMSPEREPTPLRWDDSQPVRFSLSLEKVDGRDWFTPMPRMWRGEQELDMTRAMMFTPGDLMMHENVFMPLVHAPAALRWMKALQAIEPVQLPAEHADRWLGEILALADQSVLKLPDELKIERVMAAPKPRLRLRSNRDKPYADPKKLGADVSFSYDGNIVDEKSNQRGVFIAQGRRYLERNPEAEQAAINRLTALTFRVAPRDMQGKRIGYELAMNKLPAAVRALTAEGWHVEADGKLYRTAGEIKVQVQSGIDWFELHGKANFGDQSVDLPTLLKAIKKGDGTVVLGDGTLGMLPEEWLNKYGTLGDLGQADGDHIKFGRTQVGLLDALLAAQPQVSVDEAFSRARDELRGFEGIAAADPPATFTGALRAYQAEGLGWLHFLRRFGFGGCLADDMGLGKTVQVLALIESRRLLRQQPPADGTPGSTPGPSLVVVPRSLIFNWKQEAARFTPALRVLDHTGADRTRALDHFNECDLVLTTYGTLRRDAAFFKDARFDYVILDEAQAIKNAATESSKAVRLLRGDHRLVMSGTPIENHLGDLWSLFDFLNPGMLGTRNALGMNGKTAAPESRQMLAHALRPFILRRTKQQVAKDLPKKTEQSILCDLPAEQRQLYNELREHYRQSLLTRVATEGLAKSKIHVLEALLRLRQAACHPGLIDKARGKERSAKLDLLVPQLLEVAQEGHKAIVFSQFTSFLTLLKQRLAAEPNAPRYEYLDGKTADRQIRVENFQNNADCKLFLISLKAGGFGLNLTAAEYVFLLDPWWNPAVEAQAIDRAHRIGQDKAVFAYRLIARDTVEEKIVELQNSKRDLADAIINADNSLIRSLTRDDLEMLLT